MSEGKVIQIKPYEIISVKTVSYIDISIQSVSLFKSADIMVKMFDANRTLIDIRFLKLEGDAYLHWPESDEYIVNWVNSNLGFSMINYVEPVSTVSAPAPAPVSAPAPAPAPETTPFVPPPVVIDVPLTVPPTAPVDTTTPAPAPVPVDTTTPAPAPAPVDTTTPTPVDTTTTPAPTPAPVDTTTTPAPVPVDTTTPTPVDTTTPAP